MRLCMLQTELYRASQGRPAGRPASKPAAHNTTAANRIHACGLHIKSAEPSRKASCLEKKQPHELAAATLRYLGTCMLRAGSVDACCSDACREPVLFLPMLELFRRRSVLLCRRTLLGSAQGHDELQGSGCMSVKGIDQVTEHLRESKHQNGHHRKGGPGWYVHTCEHDTQTAIDAGRWVRQSMGIETLAGRAVQSNMPAVTLAVTSGYSHKVEPTLRGTCLAR